MILRCGDQLPDCSTPLLCGPFVTTWTPGAYCACAAGMEATAVRQAAAKAKVIIPSRNMTVVSLHVSHALQTKRAARSFRTTVFNSCQLTVLPRYAVSGSGSAGRDRE